jgi:hypothetical protein
MRICLHHCRPDDIGVKEKVDFALTFWVVHEVPDAEALLGQIFSILSTEGTYLFVEPKLHVSKVKFERTVELGKKIGFTVIDRPKILFSRAALLSKR